MDLRLESKCLSTASFCQIELNWIVYFFSNRFTINVDIIYTQGVKWSLTLFRVMKLCNFLCFFLFLKHLTNQRVSNNCERGGGLNGCEWPVENVKFFFSWVWFELIFLETPKNFAEDQRFFNIFSSYNVRN